MQEKYRIDYKSGNVVNWFKLILYIVLWFSWIIASSLQECIENIITCGRGGCPREVWQMNLTDVTLNEI